MEIKKSYYKKMKIIRSFEELVLQLFSKNEISGTTHTCIGQEAIAVAAMEGLSENDIVFSNHRCHGHYIAYGGPIEGLLAELMCRTEGICGGRGGSQHLYYKRFYSNGVQGGIVPNAAGMAWAEKLKGTENIGIVFIGDGTLGQGVVYETMNMAALYQIPILFVIENNQYAMTTKVSEGVSGKIINRPLAFDIKTDYTASRDILELCSIFKNMKQYIRENKLPGCIVVDTYRLSAHSKGDDTRDIKEIEENKKQDPMERLKKELDSCEINRIDSQVKEELEEILDKVRKMEVSKLPTQGGSDRKKIPSQLIINRRNEKCLEQINLSLKRCMEENENIILLGEDIKDPYGGAFKVTKGLSTTYGDRVINTPISEAGFTGIAVGLAMNGMVPIVEMMFGDFVSLAFDQILNHATKYGWIWGEKIKIPMILRAPMGAGRGYGAVHSQSLEKHYLGIPGLEIMAASPVHNNLELYKYAIKEVESPLLIIENKRMYAEPVLSVEDKDLNSFTIDVIQNHKYPTLYLSIDKDNEPDVIILTYGEIAKEAVRASISALIEEEIQVDIAVFSQIYPIPMKDIKEIARSKKIITVEEGSPQGGWGSEIIASLACEYKGISYKRMGAQNCPIATAKVLEEQQMINCEKIIEAIKGVCYEN